MRAAAFSLALPLLAVPATPPLAAASVPQAEEWTLSGVEARFSFNADLLRDMGLELAPPLAADPSGRIQVAVRGEGALTVSAPRGVFGTVAEGTVRFKEGPSLVWSGGSVALGGTELRGGLGAQTLEILGTRGEPLFVADHMHVSVDRATGRLRLYNLDLRLSPGLARLMGEASGAGLAVAVLDVRGDVAIPAGSVERLEGACTNPNWGPNDVALADLSSVSQSAYQPGVRVAITPSASLTNVGTTDVPWHQKFSGIFPPYNNDQHPFLTWNMYRVADGALQQIGASALKHAFFSTNTGCGCAGGNILWVGCGDTYGVGTNEDRTNLGPRSEVTAHTGIWQRCGSIFDPNCDDIEDIPPVLDAFDRRMAVAEADLQTPGAEYYVDAWYVVRDDFNIFNTMGWREVAPAFGGGIWSFPFLTSLVPGAVVDDWVNPSNPGPNADNQLINTGEGHLKLAVRTTDLGAGQWRYDYVLWNFDFDRKINFLTVPLPAGVTVSNTSFHDVDNNAATDWVATASPTSLSWQAPSSAAAQDWGFLFSFRFEANAAPVSGSPVTVNLGIEEPPAPGIGGMILGVDILGPAAITPVELQSFRVE